jgi:hypothetical protein
MFNVEVFVRDGGRPVRQEGQGPGYGVSGVLFDGREMRVLRRWLGSGVYSACRCCRRCSVCTFNALMCCNRYICFDIDDVDDVSLIGERL